jgi:hypothetical protein
MDCGSATAFRNGTSGHFSKKIMDLFEKQAETVDRFHERCHTEGQHIVIQFGKNLVREGKIPEAVSKR